MSYTLPVCGTDCTQEPAPVDFSLCAPVIRQGPIEFLYLSARGASFTDWTSGAEWTARIDNAGTGPTDIRELHGIGTWAEAESNDTPISGNRTYAGLKTFTLSFVVDETNDVNYEWLRANECNGNYNGWFEDSITSGDSRVYGDNDGVPLFVKANLSVEADENAVQKIMITATWKARFHPLRIASPITHS